MKLKYEPFKPISVKTFNWQFFLKATQLENMKHDYVDAMRHKKLARELLEAKENVSRRKFESFIFTTVADVFLCKLD